MVVNMGQRVDKMRGLPDLQAHKAWAVPGEHVRLVDGEKVICVVTESEHWPKIDKVILKALKAMSKRGTQGALGKLQEAAFIASLDEDNPKAGLHCIAVRLLDTRRKVEEYARLREVARGRVEPRYDDRLFYGDAPWEDIVKQHSTLLRERGVLQQKKKAKQE